MHARPASHAVCLLASRARFLPFSHLPPSLHSSSPCPSSSSFPTKGLQSLCSFMCPLAVCPENINIPWGRSQGSNRRPNCTMGEITSPLMCGQPLAPRACPCARPLPFSSAAALSHCLEGWSSLLCITVCFCRDLLFLFLNILLRLMAFEDLLIHKTDFHTLYSSF